MTRVRSVVAGVISAAVLCGGMGCRAKPQPQPAAPLTSEQQFQITMRVLDILQTTQSAQAAATTRPAGGVAHVVLVWLNKPGDAAARQAILDASQQLRSIPGVVDVQAGQPIASTRPAADATFDVGIVVTFADEKALQAYATHPTHVKLTDEVLNPRMDHFRVYDIRLGR